LGALSDVHGPRRTRRSPMSDDWNAPIDQVQADCLTLRALIRGWFAEVIERARQWEPEPCPPRVRRIDVRPR
jgi:hypothetical protein